MESTQLNRLPTDCSLEHRRARDTALGSPNKRSVSLLLPWITTTSANCLPCSDMSGEELGWLLALGFALAFGVAAGAVAYYLSRAS